MQAPRDEAESGADGSGGGGLLIEPLAGWHLPLLTDPAFVPLQPLLQRTTLLRLPGQVLQWLPIPTPSSCSRQVLIARRGATPLGLIVTRPENRSGSCWRVQHLRLALESGKRALAGELLREAILRAHGAGSWIATASTLDGDRLAALREQGFQPLRTERLWRWPGQLPEATGAGDGAGAAPGDWTLRPLNRRTARSLWQLEQAACPGLLRQLLDRHVDDLLERSNGRGWMLMDPCRDQAVAAVRWLGEHAGGGHDLELTVHPGWRHLIGTPLTALLVQAARTLGTESSLWLRSDVNDKALERWLRELQAEPRGEQVLMARSVWRRQELQVPAQAAARRLQEVLQQLQPRRRPLPTPVVPR
ncbi:hypothetical protein [Cyanobium sp. CH-040]|uniref:hypothetical protein n=1 Tax=Cyanobium sp. CH-040 TaxID=2823708 RepID=UPI0020CC18C5|nr:hypothetical protein [Cyanobium sp. CH-040]